MGLGRPLVTRTGGDGNAIVPEIRHASKSGRMLRLRSCRKPPIACYLFFVEEALKNVFGDDEQVFHRGKTGIFLG